MKLGKSNVGESLLMLDNIDCAIIINIDFDEDNNKYMVFSSIKMRDKRAVERRTYIAQPFMYGSGIRMVEDVGSVPMFRERLHQRELNKSNNFIRTSSSNIMSNISNLLPPSTQQNTFANMNSSYEFNSYEDNSDNDEPQLVTPKIIKPFYFIDEIPNSNIVSNIDDLKNRLNSLKTAIELLKARWYLHLYNIV